MSIYYKSSNYASIKLHNVRPSEEKFEAVSWFPGCKKARLAVASDDHEQKLLNGKKIFLFGKSNETDFPKMSIRAMIKDLGGALASSDTSCDYVISGEPLPADEKRNAPVVNAKVSSPLSNPLARCDTNN